MPAPSLHDALPILHLPDASRVQLAALKLPVPSLVQLTVPVGMFAPLPLVTVAVQAVALSTATEGGVQLTLVAVARGVTASTYVSVVIACSDSVTYRLQMVLSSFH